MVAGKATLGESSSADAFSTVTNMEAASHRFSFLASSETPLPLCGPERTNH
jgi:hypothetical protein